MIDPGLLALGPHAGYIVASYLAALLILGWMTLGSLLRHRAAARRLAALEARDTARN